VILPLGDDNSDRSIVPFLTYALIAVNILVFVFLQDLGADHRFTNAYSTVPAEILTGRDIVTSPRVVVDPSTKTRYQIPGLEKTPITVYLTLITSMFMHGGLGHLFGNMLYLFIFGDNLEDRMGRRRYLMFYLLCGVLAGLTHVFVSFFGNSGLHTPTLGASGAISGVLGGYIHLFPRRKVRVLLFRFITRVPAMVALGLWFLFQLLSGLGSAGGEGGGVAYGAHIGGFIAGFLLVNFFAGPDTVRRRVR